MFGIIWNNDTSTSIGFAGLQMDKMRPEFRAGIDALTKYIFDRTQPKRLGSLVMTGSMFAGLTQSFLDAINAGAVPTIATSWQVCTTELRSYRVLDRSPYESIDVG